MLFQPRHIKCIQIPQNGTTGLAEPYKTFFVTDFNTVKCTQNKFGGGTFEIVLPYSERNVLLFSGIKTTPTFIALSFYLEGIWDSETQADAPHPMPMVVESYNEEHDLLNPIKREGHTITISGRGVLDVLLANKVAMPKLVYETPYVDEPDKGYYIWDILVDLFARNINGETLPEGWAVTVTPEEATYLLPESDDRRFVSNVSFIHNIEPITEGDLKDPKFERTFEGDNLLDLFTKNITAYNLYVRGRMNIDVDGKLHFDYELCRLTDLTVGSSTPLVYDYYAMPPKTFNRLLSTQELKQIVYVKLPAENEGENNIATVTRGPETNKKFSGWFCKEMFVDDSSLPFGESYSENYNLMLTYAAADELYGEGNMLIEVDDIEYLYTPMKYYRNCWPGCKYSSYGPDGMRNTMVITSFVLTGSTQDGWIITPELVHYTEPYIQQ